MIPIIKADGDLSRIRNRSRLEGGDKADAVRKIVNDVRARGDAALFEYAEKFDGVRLNAAAVEVTEREIDAACAAVSDASYAAIREARDNIVEYHERQKRGDLIVKRDGRATGFVMRPVERAGIYVPGGKAPYPSSVLMCALPAVVAGVKELVMVTPGGANLQPLTMAAARLCGVKRIFRVGGAHAIAALAFGTESIPRADVIAGPGNIYVALAKKEVFGHVGIDMIAGPSEILIIADGSANPEFVAADLLSQAEHDELAMSVLLTPDERLARAVVAEVKRQLKGLERRATAAAALSNYGAAVIVDDLNRAVELSNEIAPEHLEICTADPEALLASVKNAGSVFLGNYSPEPLGDYLAGTNHVLPTSGTARFFSGLGVDNFMKRIGVIKYEKDALLADADKIIELATQEGFGAHANSVRIRR
ncbi:MAG: histidinol dehydrogenase [Clostridiales bacterium]|jgi:histidinol dehydrogenase|nr:histidinol dehydrogenase [Clostridiales bacterium]